MTPLILTTLLDARAARRAVVLATRLSDGAQQLFPDSNEQPKLRHHAIQTLSSGRSELIDIDGERWFLAVHAPPHRLVIIGAVHIAQALAPLAVAVGFVVTVVDPRGDFNTAERFPGIALDHGWPDERLEALAPDQRTAIITLTHDPKLDDPALDRALRCDAFYIGALGSRKTHLARLERLASAGHTAASLSRIHGPAGLPIGAVAPSEIALSIIAEIVAVRRRAAIALRTDYVIPSPTLDTAC